LLWPIDTNLGVWVAYTKTQLGIATHVYVIKVKVNILLEQYVRVSHVDDYMATSVCNRFRLITQHNLEICGLRFIMFLSFTLVQHLSYN